MVVSVTASTTQGKPLTKEELGKRYFLITQTNLFLCLYFYFNALDKPLFMTFFIVEHSAENLYCSVYFLPLRMNHCKKHLSVLFFQYFK